MKTFRHEGYTRNITPAADVASGQIVALGSTDRVGIAVADIPANTVGAILLGGVFRVTAPAHGLDQHDEVRMDLSTQLLVATGGTVIGEVDEVGGTDVIDVLLNASPTTAT